MAALVSLYAAVAVVFCRDLFGNQAIGMKKLSILLGTGGQLALSAGYWGYITPKIL